MPTIPIDRATQFKQSAKPLKDPNNEWVQVQKGLYELSEPAVRATKQEDPTQTHWKITLKTPLMSNKKQPKKTWFVFQGDVAPTFKP